MASPARPAAAIRFGEFELNATTGELRKSGIPLKIHPQPFRVLLLLVERPAQIVTREEIQNCLWGDNTYVDFEGGINFCIKQVRDTLADDAEKPRYIETVPRRGYRFIASVTLIEPAKYPIPFVRPLGLATEPIAVAEKPPQRDWRRSVLGLVTALILVALGVGWYKWRSGSSERSAEPAERQLTANPPEDYVWTAAIAPDGKHVAYLDQTGLLVRSVNSGEIRHISLPADFPAAQIWAISWFPDGGRLLVTRRASVSEETSVWIVPVLGEAAPKLLREQTFPPAISPDGKSMVFETGALHQPREIWVSGLAGEAPRKLLAPEKDQRTANPVWSPDGKWIAYWHGTLRSPQSLETSIEILPVTGGSPRTLVSESDLPSSGTLACQPFGCLNWSPGRNLVFTVEDPQPSSGESKWSLWQIHANPADGFSSQKPRRLTQPSDFIPSSMTTTADGKILAFTKLRVNQDIYVGELNQQSVTLKTPRRLSLDNHDSMPEAWTHDGQNLLFVSNRDGVWELFKQGLHDSVPERIVSNSERQLGNGNGLSPDGAWILYWEFSLPQGKDSHARGWLMRRPTAGGAPETVLELPPGAVDIQFACPQKPARICVMSDWDENILRFYALDPLKGKGDQLGKIELDRHWATAWALSPDGSQLAVVDHSNKDRVEIFTLSNHAWHEVSVEPGWGDLQSVAWAADAKGFFLTTYLPESFNLVHVTMSGKSQLLLNYARRQWMTRPLPSPDGKYLAFQTQTPDSNIWLLEKF
jgi:eukaryotic-like serine/threonine-protein kinase